MSGPWHRFKAMHRWWILMAVMTAMTLAGIAVESETDWIKLVAYGIVFLILWVPSLVLMVLFPRLRAGTATVFTVFGIFSVSPVGLV